MVPLRPVPVQADSGGRPRRRRLKNVPVLPSLLTLGNLLCGFSAVYFCLRTVYGVGAGIDPAAAKTAGRDLAERLLPSFLAIGGWCIYLGMVFDAFDGFVARLRRSASPFGVQLDSLADVVTFGLAPAILVIALLTQANHEKRLAAAATGRAGQVSVLPPSPAEEEVGLLTDDRIGRGRWVLVAVYVACAAIRLARFNVETGTEESAHRGFKGLPSPAAAGLVASLVVLREHSVSPRVWYGHEAGAVVASVIVTCMPFVTFATALLMVSRYDYRHVVNVYLRGKRPIGYVVTALAGLFLFLLFPEVTAAFGFCFYALTGPVRWVIRSLRGRPDAGAPARPQDIAGRGDPGAEQTA